MTDGPWSQFESRKADHIRVALDSKSQVESGPGLHLIELIHEALPELNLVDVDISATCFNQKLASPLFVSSMTSGHRDGETLNALLAKVCERKGWALGAGSQRRELTDPQSHREWVTLREKHPKLFLLGNLGLSQLVESKPQQIQDLVNRIGLNAMFVHTNPLQECFQPEGSPEFRGGLQALRELCEVLTVPVILKETGCGFSVETLRRLKGIGLKAVDVSGLGGTHWGRIEGYRSQPQEMLYQAAATFANWGISTTESVLNALEVQPDFEIWASGGVRSGLDAAKYLAMGSTMVGFAQPILQAAVQGERELEKLIERLEFELKVALFCTGAKNIQALRERKRWRRK